MLPGLDIPKYSHRADNQGLFRWVVAGGNLLQSGDPLLPAEEALLAALPYRMPNWEDTSKAVIERAVREVVSRERLSDLLSVTHYNAIGGRIQGVANNSTRQWGVRIDTLIVKCIQPKPDVTAATERRWMADTDAETTITREQGEAEAMRNTLQTIAEGYEAARASGMAPNEIQREVLHHILEQFARDPLSKVQLTPELNAFIRGLAR